MRRFPGKKLILTKANADAGGRAINQRIEAFVIANRQRAHLAGSLGQAAYIAALKGADTVIGNSSSGIIEAPAADVPTVNIGTRQAGQASGRQHHRLRAAAPAIVGRNQQGSVAGVSRQDQAR